MFNPFESRIATVQYLFYTNLLVSAYYLYSYGLTYTQAGVVAVIFILMNIIGMIMTFHRYYSHKSFEFKYEWLRKLCTIFGLLSCSGSPIGWAGIHRMHHKLSDTDEDPHNAQDGFLKMVTLQYKVNFSPKTVVDLLKDKFLVTMHKYTFLPAFIYAISLFVLFGYTGLVVGFCLPACCTLISQGLTNYVNHSEDEVGNHKASNVWWINIISWGDGWHKNHHDSPRNYTTTKQWYHIDPTGWIIKHVISKKGSAYYG